MIDSIEKAMNYLKGYCHKHPECYTGTYECRLYNRDLKRCFLCTETIPADWMWEPEEPEPLEGDSIG